MKLLREKIADERFLQLVATLLRAPVLEDGIVKPNIIGCPQGSVAAPILSNIYLHYVLDEWFETIKKSHIKGRSELVRFADDAVFVFQHPQEAQRIYKVLPKRLGKYGLELHEGKSRIMLSGRKHARSAEIRKERLPTYKFLGFVCYWGKSQAGYWRLKYKSRSDRVTRTLGELRQYLRDNISQDTKIVLRRVIRIVNGWTNYHSISDNRRAVNGFLHVGKRILFKWLNRRGGKRRMNWSKFNRLLKRIQYPLRARTVSMFTLY